MTSRKEHPAAQPDEQPPESVESRLDEALEESFPASDPVAIDATDPYDPRLKEKDAADASPKATKKHQAPH